MMNPILNLPHPAIMGILNVTPDSFSDGGKYNTLDTALSHAEDMLEQGADLIDLGGCSTRPNNAIATEDEELQRVIPVLQALKKHFPKVLISIDTFRKNVAQAWTLRPRHASLYRRKPHSLYHDALRWHP